MKLTCPYCKKVIRTIPIEKDRNALIKLYEEYQTLSRRHTDKLRETVKFFQVLISVFIVGSFGLGVTNGLGFLNPYVGIILSIFGIGFSIIGIVDIKRCYQRFLEWLIPLWNIEKLLGLYEKTSNTAVESILPKEFDSKEKILKIKDALRKKSFVFEALKNDTLLRTYTSVFLFFIIISIVSIFIQSFLIHEFLPIILSAIMVVIFFVLVQKEWIPRDYFSEHAK